MKLKKYIEFINESVSIHEGDFKVTKDMVSNGKMIAELIPREVTGHFNCSDLELTSLEGSPETVGGNFWCKNLKLTTLEGCPETVGGNFWCKNNQLTSLAGSPKEIEGYFGCENNLLLSLEGCPETVGGDFVCSNNSLSSLEGCPSKVGGTFWCSGNEDLKIESDFIESGQYKDNYWMDLLKYMIDTNIDLEEVKGWPKDFLNDEIIQSAKGISKFKL